MLNTSRSRSVDGNSRSLRRAGLSIVVALDGSASSEPNGGFRSPNASNSAGRSQRNDAETSCSYSSRLIARDCGHRARGKKRVDKRQSAIVPASPSLYADDIALKARVTASSLGAGFNQALYKAIDGNTGRLQQRHYISGRPRKVELGVGQVRAGRARRQAPASCRMAVLLTTGLRRLLSSSRMVREMEVASLGNHGTVTMLHIRERTVPNVTLRNTAVNPFTINVGLGEIHDFWRGAP